jgi:biotin transport system substrate-specific component
MATLATSRLNRLPVAERGITIGDFLVPIRLSERVSARVRHVFLIVAGALLIALTANFRINLPDNPVPITGQTLAVLLVGGALGFRRGFLATALYVLMGLFLPVYANNLSGIEVIGKLDHGHLVLGPRGGYLIGFIFAAAVVGRLAELGWDRKLLGAFAAMIVGSIVIYAIALPWLAASTGWSASETIAKGFQPFVIGDALKLLLAAALFPLAWWVVGRRPGER